MQLSHMRAFAVAIAVGASFFIAAQAPAVVVYQEPGSGELSSNGNAPTPMGAFSNGVYSVISTSGGGDIDDFTFTIPAGSTLQSIVPSSYTGDDATAFIGIQVGPTMDHSGSSLRGWVHFGPGPANVGTDILDDMGGTLGPGTYTVWMQQAGSTATYQMDFIVPEPGSITSIAMLALAFTTARARRKALVA